MILVIPVTRVIVGTSIGTQATIVPLVFAAFPFTARLVESSLREVNPNIIEMAQSMGASPFKIVTKVLIPESVPSLLSNATIALTTVLGYSAMSGILGGGGTEGDLGGIQAGCSQTVAYHNADGDFVKGNCVRTVGGFIDLKYQINDTWSAAIGYGFDDPVDSDVEGGVGSCDILYNDRLYLAAFYKITDNFRLGLEYARLMTSYGEDDSDGNGGVNGGDVHANRVQFNAFYDF